MLYFLSMSRMAMFCQSSSGISIVFLKVILPSCGYTLIAALPLYGIFHFIHERLMPNSNRTIEQAIHTTIESYERGSSGGSL